jgi:murein DD-endopeptidase MepM/ murein hydrolase activator NlpD
VTLRWHEETSSPRRSGGFAKRSRRMQCRAVRGSIRPAVRGVVTLVSIAVLASGSPGVAHAAAADSSRAGRTAGGAPAPRAVLPFAPPFAHLPLAPPLSLNGGFGEYRSNHFHGGLDLGTGGEVGRPVLAPLPGWIERVRASGAGYGRSLYLHGEDGRLLVFGHLDAFAAPIAAYVAAAQESTGQYEVDLWPEAGRFRVSAGERIAWTGESGAGGPHLHIEVRRGDMAYHPLRAGLVIADSSAPTLVSVTLEPLDEASWVERSAAPVTIPLGGSPATVTMIGRARAVVAARDGIWRGVDRMVPWSVALGFDRVQVECRFDSVSWATDMSESDYIYDTGGVTGERGMLMWAPPGFRPRILRSTASIGEDAGTLVVRPGDSPRTLRLVARDVAGNVCERTLVLRPPASGAGAPDSARAGGRALADSSGWFQFSSLPGNRLRVTFRGAPAGSRGVTIDGRPASLADGDWSTVIPLEAGSRDTPFHVVATGRNGSGRPWTQAFQAVLRPDPTAPERSAQGGFLWTMPLGAQFEAGPVLYRRNGATPAAPRELVERSDLLELIPLALRLRRPLRIEWGGSKAPAANVGLYSDDGEGWGWIGSPLDSATGRRVGETRHFGRFALFADTLAPRLTPLRTPSHALGGPYSRWALETRVREEGSGVDPRASWVEVDGRKLPAEWDGEKEVLRWRPLRAPKPGPHRYTVVVRDRAGNERRATGRFVMK